MTPKILLLSILLVVAAGCKPKVVAHSVTTAPPAPTLVTIASVASKDLDKATSCLGRHNINFSLDSDNHPTKRIMVVPGDEIEATDLLTKDAKAKGYKLLPADP